MRLANSTLHVGVFFAPDKHTGLVDAVDVRTPLLHVIHRRAVQRKDARLHPLIDTGGGILRVVLRNALGDKRCDDLLRRESSHELLAHARRLPDLGELMPGVVLVDGAAADSPGADEVGAYRHQARHEECAPIVTHDVHRLTDILDLGD
jgi:hypothetical protein